MKKDNVKQNEPNHNKVKRKIYIRTFSTLMAVYLVLMAGFSILTLNKQSEIENSHYYQWAMDMNYGIISILQINMDSNCQIIDPEKLKMELAEGLSILPYRGVELAIFTGDCNLIYNTDSCIMDGKKYIQNELMSMVLDKGRLQELLSQDHYDSVDRVSLVTARFYCPVPYRKYGFYEGTDNAYGTFWTVVGFQTNLLKQSIDTLLFVWISCFTLFVAVAILLSAQSYRIFRKKVELDRLRTETTNALAHDLKTPLSIISGYAQNLIENIHTEKRDYYAANINANVNRMDGIIREMLELSRYDTDSNKLIYEDVSLGKVCSELMERYRQVCNDKQLTVNLEGNAVVKADFSLMERVVDNFFVNAIEFTPEAGTIHIRISDNKLEFYNSGSHIPEDMINEIWEPYKKADASRSNKKGSGLGLSISGKILNLYKFSFGAKNNNDGVTFWFQW